MTDHWYHWSTTIDLDTNQITEVSLTILTSGNTVTRNPADRFVRAGADPDHHCLFAGGSVVDNTLAFDNASIRPAPGAIALLGLGGLVAIRRRR